MTAHWYLTYRADKRASALADRHYSRQTVGAAQFAPPGRALVLLNREASALWVTSFPYPEYVLREWKDAQKHMRLHYRLIYVIMGYRNIVRRGATGHSPRLRRTWLEARPWILYLKTRLRSNVRNAVTPSLFVDLVGTVLAQMAISLGANPVNPQATMLTTKTMQSTLSSVPTPISRRTIKLHLSGKGTTYRKIRRVGDTLVCSSTSHTQNCTAKKVTSGMSTILKKPVTTALEPVSSVQPANVPDGHGKSKQMAHSQKANGDLSLTSMITGVCDVVQQKTLHVIMSFLYHAAADIALRTFSRYAAGAIPSSTHEVSIIGMGR